VALDGGYSDQAHLIREFRSFAGLTPGRYRAVSPEQPNHVAEAG
jgi:AraC-like DNA-binding protein